MTTDRAPQMTLSREEILAMPAGPEMDALVAIRVLGWELREDTGLWTNNATRQWSITAKHLPQSSASIKAAWGVVEKLTAMPTPYLIGFRNVASSDGITWEVEITEPIEAETFPLAICRAALLTTLDSEAKS